MKEPKFDIITLATLVGLSAFISLKIAAISNLYNGFDPTVMAYRIGKKDLRSRIAVSFGTPAAYAFETGGYNREAPIYDKEKNQVRFENEIYEFKRAVLSDQDENGSKESILERFENLSGKIIIRYTTNGKTWAWGIFNNPSDRNDNITNYMILDSNGRGFDRKYGANEDHPLPQHVR